MSNIIDFLREKMYQTLFCRMHTIKLHLNVVYEFEKYENLVFYIFSIKKIINYNNFIFRLKPQLIHIQKVYVVWVTLAIQMKCVKITCQLIFPLQQPLLEIY